MKKLLILLCLVFLGCSAHGGPPMPVSPAVPSVASKIKHQDQNCWNIFQSIPESQLYINGATPLIKINAPSGAFWTWIEANNALQTSPITISWGAFVNNTKTLNAGVTENWNLPNTPYIGVQQTMDNSDAGYGVHLSITYCFI